MSTLSATTYTVDEIHKMRVEVAELYRAMKPDEAERDFLTRVESAKKTMEALRKEKRLSVNYRTENTANDSGGTPGNSCA